MIDHKHLRNKNECSVINIGPHVTLGNAEEKEKEKWTSHYLQLNTGPTSSQSELHTNRLQQ